MQAGRRVDLPDIEATRALGRKLAAVLRAGDVVALRGDLGAGKSELARTVIRALAGAEIEVPSPTFTILQHYPCPGLHITHADLYRLGDASEVTELGLQEAWADGALLIEWPERAGDTLPVDRLTILLEADADDRRREATMTGGPGWQERLRALCMP